MINVDTSIENILEGFDSVLRWKLDHRGHGPVQGFKGADGGGGLRSRESGLIGVKGSEETRTSSAFTEEGIAAKGSVEGGEETQDFKDSERERAV